MSLTLLERENQTLRTRVEQLEQRNESLEHRTEVLSEALSKAAREKALLERKLKELLRKRTGLDLDAPGQQWMLFGEPGQPEETPEHADEAPDGETPNDAVRLRHRPKRKVRQLSWTGLPREHLVHELPPEQRVCPITGLPLVETGETIREDLDYRPAKLVVLVNHIKTYGLSPEHASQRTVPAVSARAPLQPIEKSPASAGLLAWMLVQKYRHHLPLYRQQAIFAREGLAIPRQTQCGWVMACAELLLPIQAALKRHILTSGVQQLDDTPVQCQLGPDGTKTQAYLWVLLSPLVEGVVYDFTLGRGYDELHAVVGDLAGYLVGDGYVVHKKLAEQSEGRLVTSGCWSHALRKFRDGLIEAPAAASAMVVTIGQLFAIERDADAQELLAEARRALRRERCPAVLEQIEAQVAALRGQTSAQGTLAEAVGYVERQWPSLVRFLEDGRLPIHNNACELAIRPIAVGRRNWLFAGSPRGGAAAATIYSLIESCRRADVDPFDYLRDVLVRVRTHPARLVADLVPARWKQLFGAQAAR